MVEAEAASDSLAPLANSLRDGKAGVVITDKASKPEAYDDKMDWTPCTHRGIPLRIVFAGRRIAVWIGDAVKPSAETEAYGDYLETVRSCETRLCFDGKDSFASALEMQAQ